MADRKDDLAVLRWFRRRLAWLGRQSPHLKQPAHQERLADALDRHTEEEIPCHANPPDDHADDHQAPAD